MKFSQLATLAFWFLLAPSLGTSAEDVTRMAWSDPDHLTMIAQTHQHKNPAHAPAAHGHDMGSHPHKGHEHKNHQMQAPPKSKLKPAEGAAVKILAPKPGETFTGDQVSIRFRLVKGKRGHHIHAYVDGELMGMFTSEKGTLTGIRPGHHVLELRVVAEDHQTELDALDRVEFMVK